jgi:hypothetical protein
MYLSNQSVSTGDHMITVIPVYGQTNPWGRSDGIVGIGSQCIENGQWKMSRAQGPVYLIRGLSPIPLSSSFP